MIEGLPSPSKLVRASLLIVAVLFGLAFLWSYLSDGTDLRSYPYSQMLAEAAAGRVNFIVQDDITLTVTFIGQAEPRIVRVASDAINVYAEVCAATGNPPGPTCPINYEVVAASTANDWVGLLISTLLPVLIIGAFFFFMMRAAQQKKE